MKRLVTKVRSFMNKYYRRVEDEISAQETIPDDATQILETLRKNMRAVATIYRRVEPTSSSPIRSPSPQEHSAFHTSNPGQHVSQERSLVETDSPGEDEKEADNRAISYVKAVLRPAQPPQQLTKHGSSMVSSGL